MKVPGLRIGGRRGMLEVGRHEPEGVRTMSVHAYRGADAIRSHKGAQPGQGFLELIGIPQGGFKEGELALLGTCGFGVQFHAGNGGVGPHRLQMRVQHPEQGVRGPRGLGNAQVPFEEGAGILPQGEAQGFRDKSAAFEAMADLFGKPAQEKEQRFERLDGGIELKGFHETFGRPHQVQGTHGAGGGRGQKGEGFQSEAFRQFRRAERQHFAHGAHAPLVEDVRDVG